MQATYVYKQNLSAWLERYRVIANKGGTRSGKTYSLVSLFISVAVAGKKIREIDIVSESMPHLKRGALNDFNEILDREQLVDGVDYESNLSDHVYTFNSGTKIRFFSSDDWGKVKGSKRDVLYINECNRIDYEIYRQLAVRTTECIFLDWNPDTEFWYELKGVQTKDSTKEIHSTYKDNPFLSDVQIAEIESNKDDENWWKVYGLGLTGRPQGVIYKRWEQVDAIPDYAELVGRGLDFGFTNDPTAIVDVYRADGELWLDERCYRINLTNDKIAEFLRPLPGCTVADSAEQKSIAEIKNYGVRWIEPAIKGADSIRAGIQILQRYKMNVTKRSLNLINEIRNYKWKEDKITGELLNVPIDKYNHALDAVRYVALNKLSKRPIIRRPRAKLGEI
ncbi:terminase large subunit [uncultured Bacteroides sp.]|jgi:phage terminase large subunit|uniref:PBSX family phage terminase large subunit n=1 Tax=uncultured Bacteroides sp. TaxID=162156 RepID=UPI0020481C36|nr:terminase large subunit [uncultured Bacteroides sp.]DAL45101.1 MAG TPA_asm: terminase large subunit [Caudoviricetes sp.]